MRPSVLGLVMAILLVPAACSTDATAGRISATVQAPAAELDDPDEDDRWLVAVTLREGTIEGSARVLVAFYGDELSCPVDELRAGVAVEFTRVGRDTEAADPPIIAGTNLDMECEDED